MCFGDPRFSEGSGLFRGLGFRDVKASKEVDDVLRIFMSRLSTLKYSFLPPRSLETGFRNVEPAQRGSSFVDGYPFCLCGRAYSFFASCWNHSIRSIRDPMQNHTDNVT